MTVTATETNLLGLSRRARRLLPKAVFVGEIASQATRIAQFDIEFSSNSPGEISGASTVLAKLGVNILTGFHTNSRWAFFADITNSWMGAPELKRELEKLGYVKQVLTQEGKDGIIVDGLHYPLTLGDDRMAIFDIDTLRSTLNRVRQIFGEEGSVGKVMLYEMGRASGTATFRWLLGNLDRSKVMAQLSNLLNVYSAKGLAVLEAKEVDFNRAVAILQMYDSFECVPMTGSNGLPYSQFIRGHLAGFFSRIFGTHVTAIETKCVSQGESCCEFEIRPDRRDSLSSGDSPA